jgi:hypothetical protein
MRTLVLLACLLFTLPSFATWELVNEKSQLNFVTTNLHNETESDQFVKLQGSISVQGKISLVIDLMSTKNNISQNDPLQKLLFQTGMLPKALFSSVVNSKKINKLNVGDVVRIELAGEIGLQGFKEPVNTPVQIKRMSKNSLQVKSLTPIVVEAKDLNLDESIKKLLAIANLPSISNTATITFSLYFSR